MDLSALGASSYGVRTRSEALRLLTAGAVDEWVRSGTWQVLWRGVYTDAGHVPDVEQRAVAAVLAVGGRLRGPVLDAVPSGRTAARLWRLRLIDDDDPATGACEHPLDDVAVARSLPHQSFGGRRLRPSRAAVGRADLVRHPNGSWVTTPARTLADPSRLLSLPALVCAVDAALHRHLVTVDSLQPYLTGRRMRAALGLADGRAESPGETLARLLLRPVLPGLVPQVRLLDRVGRPVARFDLGDRAVRLAVEVDGKRGHAGSAMVAKDRRRDRSSEALGWVTERVTWYELRRQQASFVRRVVQRDAELRTSRAA